MSQRCIGYAGEGKARRPIWTDEGPASASIAGRFGEGKTALLDGLPDRLEGGASPVEKRMATEAQKAAWAAEEITERPRKPVPPVWPAPQQEEPTVSNDPMTRGGIKPRLDDNELLPGPTTMSTIALDAEPASGEPAQIPAGSPFAELVRASMEADEAWEAFRLAAPRWDAARAHLADAWRAVSGEVLVEGQTVPAPIVMEPRVAAYIAGTPILEEARASVALDGQTQVVEPNASEERANIPEIIPGLRVKRGPTKRQIEIHDAYVRLGSQSAVARELGITQGGVMSVLRAYDRNVPTGDVP